MNPKAILDLVDAVVEKVIELSAKGMLVGEIKERLRDGVQRGDLVSDEGLAKVKAAGDRLAKYRGGA